MAFTINKIPNEVIDNFKNGYSIFFVGAGLSEGAGYPSWGRLIELLIDHANKQPWISEDKIIEYNKLLKDNSKFLFLAEELKIELGSQYYTFMEEHFANSDIQPTMNHELLVSIKSNLILTINYDNLIEKAYIKIKGDYPNTFTYSQSKEAANNFWKERFFILKAHGDAKRDVNTLILSQKDYRRTLYREPGYRSLLQSIFTSKSILFIGISLTDPEFNQLLDFLHDSYHGGGPTHYLLLDSSKNSTVLSRRYLA
ncbi:MAG: SIR2 family protein [Bacteroidales bacterium]|nr:SIR2 family protein [Bacteroidales bacterium]